MARLNGLGDVEVRRIPFRLSLSIGHPVSTFSAPHPKRESRSSEPLHTFLKRALSNPDTALRALD